MDENYSNKNFEGKAKLWKHGRVLLIILSLFLIVQILSSLKEYRYIGEDASLQNIIVVSGEGEMFAVPDIATFSFTVSEEAKVVADAQQVATQKINSALNVLKNLCVEEKDIQTTGYNVYPKYEYISSICTQFSCPPGRQNLVGYEVSQTITVKVRKVEDAGSILSSLGSTQVSSVSGLQFTVDDEESILREARQKAIENAKEKAKTLAKDLDVRLGRIVNFSESGNFPIYAKTLQMADSVGGMGGETPPAPQIPVGENRIVSNVTITYEIK